MPSAKDQNLPRVAVFFSRIGPYHYARLKAAGSKMTLTAIEFSEVDSTYAWDVVAGAECFARFTLFPGAEVSKLSTNLIVTRVAEVLGQVRPQAVAISGWSDRCSLAVLQWCISNRVTAIVMSETTAWDDARKWWKEAVKRRLVGLFSAALVGGQAHADYLEQLSFPRPRIAYGYDAVDNDYFAQNVAAVRALGDRSSPVAQLPAGPFFLASARFIEKKNLDRLLQAYARYRQLASRSERPTPNAELWNLILVGDGPLRATLNSQLSTLNLHGHVQMPGFKQYHELPSYYALASGFIHASTTEQWGLVVNEAMASGLPVLVSNRCGCASDLVQNGINGFTFDPSNVEEMAQVMFRLATLGSQLAAFGAASKRIIASWGTARFAEGLSQAVACALRKPCPAVGGGDRLLLRLLLLR